MFRWDEISVKHIHAKSLWQCLIPLASPECECRLLILTRNYEGHLDVLVSHPPPLAQSPGL